MRTFWPSRKPGSVTFTNCTGVTGMPRLRGAISTSYVRHPAWQWFEDAKV
jgi:hypothetical protein